MTAYHAIKCKEKNMDKKYINRTVMHKKHGKGIITNIVNNDITVKFDKEYIYFNFKFPEAFKDWVVTALFWASNSSSSTVPLPFMVRLTANEPFWY